MSLPEVISSLSCLLISRKEASDGQGKNVKKDQGSHASWRWDENLGEAGTASRAGYCADAGASGSGSGIDLNVLTASGGGCGAGSGGDTCPDADSRSAFGGQRSRAGSGTDAYP